MIFLACKVIVPSLHPEEARSAVTKGVLRRVQGEETDRAAPSFVTRTCGPLLRMKIENVGMRN
jgi:hypothetical protein